MKSTFQDLDPSDCLLKDTRIDIWQYPLHTAFAGAADLLNEDETTRAHRYHFARHQRRFTVARATLRLILSRYLNLPPTKLVFSYGKQGKPACVHPTALQFNLSHSGDFALLAVGKTMPMGIDLELFSARPYEGIGEHLFSEREIQALRSKSNQLKPLVFFNIWAQKEAFIKACGLGLAYPTKQFDVSALPVPDQEIMDNLHHKKWKMIPFMPAIGCSAALCFDPRVEEIRYIKLTNFTSIIN